MGKVNIHRTSELEANIIGYATYELKMGTLMNNGFDEDTKLGIISHELFHGYQRHMGNNPKTINAEVEAYAFERMMYTIPGSGSELGTSSKMGQQYTTTMRDFIMGYNVVDNYNKALHLFKNGSKANSLGAYKTHEIDHLYKSLLLDLINKYY